MNYKDKFLQIQSKLFINGQFVDSIGGKNFDVINPATEEVIGQAVAASKDDVNLAVQSARHAFDKGEWRKINAYERAKMLYKFADLLDANA